MKMKIGILGGTFDPIHLRHIELAESAKEQYNLERVYIMPDREPAHKNFITGAAADDRLAMVNIALKKHPGLLPSSFEINRTGPTYTSDTLAELKKLYPDNDFYFIVGSDSVMYMEKWHRPDIIFQLCHVLYIMRPGDSKEEVSGHIKFLSDLYKNVDISLVDIPESDVSSTEIREKLREGLRDADSLHLDPEVLEYIVRHGLYMREGE